MCAKKDGVNATVLVTMTGRVLKGEVHFCKPMQGEGWSKLLRELFWGLTAGLFQYIPSHTPFRLSFQLDGAEFEDTELFNFDRLPSGHPLQQYANVWRWRVTRPRHLNRG